jgi:hypothetical protein
MFKEKIFTYLKLLIYVMYMHSVAWWLKHCVTSRKVGGSRPDEVIKLFSIYLIPPASLDHGVYSASNRNEYQKQKIKCFWGVMGGRCVRLSTS